MSYVNQWRELADEVVRLFPEANRLALAGAEDDVGALIQHISDAHDLTLNEAAEMVAFRLPTYLPAMPQDTGHRLSA